MFYVSGDSGCRYHLADTLLVLLELRLLQLFVTNFCPVWKGRYPLDIMQNCVLFVEYAALLVNSTPNFSLKHTSFCSNETYNFRNSLTIGLFVFWYCSVKMEHCGLRTFLTVPTNILRYLHSVRSKSTVPFYDELGLLEFLESKIGDAVKITWLPRNAVVLSRL